MTKFTEPQIATLRRLSRVLAQATANGTLDLLQANCINPDSINDVAEALAEEIDGAGKSALTAEVLYNKIIAAADEHAEDSGADYEVGDLQAALELALDRLTPDQLQEVHDELAADTFDLYWSFRT